MFEVDIIENRRILNCLLSANYEFFFDEGMVASNHKHGMCMILHRDESIDVPEPMVNDMSSLANVLASKTVTSATFSPESGRIIVSRPYKWLPTIPRLRDDKYQKEVQKNLDNIDSLRKASKRKSWTDRYGKKHKISSFTIDNQIVGDSVRRLGKSESLEIRIGKNLMFTNKSTNEKVIHEVTGPKCRIFLSSDGRSLFLDSLIGDESKITMASKVVMLVENDIQTILAGRIPG